MHLGSKLYSCGLVVIEGVQVQMKYTHAKVRDCKHLTAGMDCSPKVPRACQT